MIFYPPSKTMIYKENLKFWKIKNSLHANIFSQRKNEYLQRNFEFFKIPCIIVKKCILKFIE